MESPETAVRPADVDEDRRQPWSEGAVLLQSDDDNDNDGFVSPLKATVNFKDYKDISKKESPETRARKGEWRKAKGGLFCLIFFSWRELHLKSAKKDEFLLA